MSDGSTEGMPEPTVNGLAGRAWRCDLEALRGRLKVAPEDDGTVVMWVVEAPWAHPLWHSYALVLVHLRPMPDGRPTKIYLDGASHELWLYALNPKCDRGKAVQGQAPLQWLTPVNFAAQLIEPSDTAAFARIHRTVEAICAGRLNPDTDARSQWTTLFGDNMMRDADAAR